MTITAQSAIAGPVNRVFQQQLLRQARARCTYYVGSSPGDLSSHAGSFTVLWRRIDAFTPTTTALTELSGTISYPTRAATAAAVTDVTAAVSKYGQHIFLTEDADLVNPNGLVAGLVTTLAISAGQSLNRLRRNVLEDNATAIYASGASANSGVADAISLPLIRNAVNVLERNSARTFTPMTTGDGDFETSPIPASYWGLVHSDVAMDIRDLTGFIPAEKYGGQTALGGGEFGTVGGVRWLSSPEGSITASVGGDPGASLRSTNGTDVDVYESIVLGMDAHGSVSLDADLIQDTYEAGDSLPGLMLISHDAGSGGTGDPFNEVRSMAWKAWHGGALLNGNFVRMLSTGASALT